MEFKTIAMGHYQISEVVSKEVLIKNDKDALELIGNAPSQFIVLYEHNFENDFFDLSTRKLGEVLQKFTNYRMKLAIIGNFETRSSEVLKDFIYESNKHGEFLFVSSMDQVIELWKR